MPADWIKQIDALIRKLDTLQGNEYGLAKQSLEAASHWLFRALER